MSESSKKNDPIQQQEDLGLTQNLRKLTVRVDTVGDALEEKGGTALLLCRDSASRKWGPRWLSQAGFQATVPPDPANAVEIARAISPDVIFVEAYLVGAGGIPIYQLLMDCADIQTSIVVLCSGSREISAAIDAGAFDVACKPYEWQAISNRAKYAMQLRSSRESLVASTAALTDALKLANDAREKLRSQESFEPVTGLPNKSKFIDLLRRAMRTTERSAGALAVFVIGFTRFRLVIEAMGQEQADRILTEIGKNLSECLRNTETEVDPSDRVLRTAAIATLDQFRFGLMLTCSEKDDSLNVLQQDLLEILSRPIQILGQTVHLSPCLGVALYPQDADDVDSLLQRADNAMRDSQSRGGGFKYYCAETDAAAARKLRIEHLLHEALDRDELTVVYQPIIGVSTGKTIAAEALLRWQQADGQFVSPNEFIVVAEESGLMIRTGEFVLNQACRDFVEFRKDGVDISCICVNVAKVQLTGGGFARTVRRVLDAHDMQPSQLELEISERGVLSGDYDVINQLHELKALGVRLSIDDFGTGESAIAYLKDLPVDVLKIDQSYICGLAEDGKDAAIASAMVALGQRLDLLVIAEGVETEAQLAKLKDLDCDAYQGFLASRGVPATVFTANALASQKKAK